MRILHVLSQYEVTGAETYAVALADQQIANGHSAIIVSDTLSTQTSAEYIKFGIGQRKPWQRIRNIAFLRKLIHDRQIDVVHAHSRAASWVCYFACLNTNTAMVSTVHGRQHLHRSSRGFDIYGDQVVAVCPDLKVHLQSELFLDKHKLHFIPNGFHFSSPEPEFKHALLPQQEEIRVCIVGRASGPKGDRTTELISKIFLELLAEFPQLKIYIVGSTYDSFNDINKVKLDYALQKFPGRILFSGFVAGLNQFLAKAHLSIGAGRVAIQTIANGRPFFAAGERSVIGFMKESTLQQGIQSNFGDCSPTEEIPGWAEDSIKNEMREFLKNPSAFAETLGLETLAKRVRELYPIERVAADIEAVYIQARAKRLWPKHLPILMYHKVPDQPLNSKHKIFVNKKQFSEQMNWLKAKNFTTMTFADYQEFRTGRRSPKEFPKKPIILTFDDGYLDNLTNVAPILTQNKQKAVIYLLADHTIDHNKWDVDQGDIRSEIMSLADKRKIAKLNFEIGSHGFSHRDLRTLSDHEVLQEMQDSKKRLEKDLSLQPILSFAYPYGYLDERLKQLAKEAGYTFAVATDNGGLHLEDDLFEIFRVNIFPSDNMKKFRRKISPLYRRWFRLSRKR